MKPRIFISYKRVDKKYVFNLKDEIESSTGEKCWIDIDGIESDAQFKNVIINAIKDCEVMLFMYSKAHSLITDFEKDWTIRELNFAANKNKRIVFINLDGTPLTDEFSFDYGLKQQVDGKSKEAVTRLITDLRKWLKPIQSESHDTGKTIDSSTENKSNNSEEDKRKEKGKHTFDIGISGKRKGCVVAFSVLASVLFLIIPSFWMFNSSNSTTDIARSAENVEDGHGIAHQEQFNGVDLGLPSGTIWANMNVGANSVSDFGDLFSWGESETKESYTDYDYVKETKNHTLQGRHDAAYTILGSEWHTPSASDFDELIENCNWRWKTLNGHNGYEIKGHNGNTIFLPASGWIHTDSVEYQNEYGYYWTSDKVNETFAKGLLFSKSEKKIGNGHLYYGRNIRAVSRSSVPVAE